MRARAAILATALVLLGTGVAHAETGLIERRFATPAIARFTATTSDDGRISVRSDSDDATPEARDERRWLEVRDGWREAPPSLGSLVEALRPLAALPVEDDGFDAIFCERVGTLKLFLDAPPTLTGDDSKPKGARIEPNRVDGYFLSDDCVSVGVHGSVGRLWVEGFLSANVYAILPLDERKFIFEKRVLARREPHRLVGRLSYALTEDRQAELFVEAGVDSPLDETASRPGVRGGFRLSF